MSDITNGAMTNNGTVGGGEVLGYVGNAKHEGYQYIDWEIVKQFASIPLVKIIIVALLILICILLILRLFNIKSILKNKGIANELRNVNNIKSRDKYVLQSNKLLGIITRVVEKTPFNVAQSEKEYLQYNINRADFKVPGGYRYLTAEEYNAIIKTIGALVLFISLIVTIFINSAIGTVMIVMTLAALAILPNLILRQIVMAKDAEIRKNFAEFYLMMHYTLVIGGSTPIDKMMKSYAKTTESEEMIRFVDNCVGHIDTNGEYNATTIISRDYREIAEVGKLMRLIKQMFDGADIVEELQGFREDLMKEREYEIEKQMNKLIGIANKCFNILMIILGQAIISAMTIYFPDMGSITSIF